MIEEVKTVVLGSGGVGKSCCTIRFIQENFVEKYDPTIEDSYRKQINFGEESFLVDILDTGGRDGILKIHPKLSKDYSSLRDQYMRMSEAFLLVYSITDPSSFEDIWQIHEQLLRSVDEDHIPTVVIGNKSDLEDERGVSTEDGMKFAQQIGASFFETSAKNGINIDIAFRELVKKVILQRKKNLGSDTDEISSKEVPTSKKVMKKKGNKYCVMM
jgi:small GTP-binding protein